ncbi:hypothetical protein CCR75_000934 [Bremia lactucae]|uniref:Uncharacterized protein n=1 Tax=Bremia lactucae TaxID=4779 RepID=A0A976FLM4_BRELC|nr:hypothetical protein CCR75_000936 [Bremia lactucae]TDH68638.1 hypothetical protein CCR75_000934 [Bremia lactucae]
MNLDTTNPNFGKCTGGQLLEQCGLSEADPPQMEAANTTSWLWRCSRMNAKDRSLKELLQH